MSVETVFAVVAAEALENRPLGDVFQPTRPRVKPSKMPDLPFIGMGHVEPHTMKLLETVPAGTMKSSAVHFQPGDVLYGRLRPYLNKVYRPNFEGLCSAEFIVFPKTEGIESGYLQYFLNSAEFVSFASGLNTGDRPRVDFQQLSEYPFPILPLDQQQQTVAEIEKQFSRLDEAVTNLHRVRANLKRYKAVVLKAAVEGRLVKTEAELARREGRTYETGEQLLQRILETRRNQWKGKGKYKEPAETIATNHSELPEGWVWATLDCLIVDGPQNGLYLPKSLYGSGHPILRIDDYQQDWIRPVAELQRVRAKADDVATYSLRSDNLVINRVNSPSHLGKVTIWTSSAEMPLFESNMMRAALSPYVVPVYVATYLRSADGRARLTKQAKWAVNQASINQQDVRGTLVPLPPISEQSRIVEEVDRRLSLVREAEVQVEKDLMRGERLRQTILTNAFVG